jgi:hypothetical protein
MKKEIQSISVVEHLKIIVTNNSSNVTVINKRV